MSVVGFDIGNENCAIAVAKHGVIDVLLNDESKRETPAVVSFGEKQRFLGSAGAAFATKNPKSTISQIKRLIGRFYKDPSLQEELKLLPFETSESPRGGILIHLQYLNETMTFLPVEILGMLFAHLKQMTEKNLGSPVANCVIGIPSYFTDLQRLEYLNAACIAGLSPLKLIHDCTAVALGYGIYKTDFSGKGPTNVMFLDIGQCDTQVTIAAFEKGKMTILSHSFDQHLGGRDFDEVLFTYFATQFKEHDNIDVNSNLRACIRLRTSCERLKKVLSANAEAALSIECLIDGKDVNGMITRKEFEKLSQELLERVAATCRNAVDHCRLRSFDKIHTIELVGSGSRIPAIKRKIANLYNKQPVRTLNGSECVARGCALDCAMLSLTRRIPEYKVEESFPYSISGLFYDVGENPKHQKVALFPKGSPFPSNLTVQCHANTSFYCHIFYTNKTDFPSRISPEAARFLIGGPSQTSGAEKVVVEVPLNLNIHGIVEIKYASIIEDKHPPRINDNPFTWLEKPRGGCARSQNLEVFENDIILTTVEELCAAQDRAEIFARKDLKVEKAKEKRYTLESFIYDTRSKLESSYWSLATDREVETIFKSLQITEDWLYEEGDDESETVYAKKLENLTKSLGLDPIENSYKVRIARKEATEALQTCIQENRLAANSLPSSQKKEIDNECVQAEEWLKHVPQLPDSLAKIVTTIYWSNAISGVTEALKRNCKVILGSNSSLSKYEEPVDSDQKPNPIPPQDHYQNSAPEQQPWHFLGGVDQPTSLPNMVNRHSMTQDQTDGTGFNTMTLNDPGSELWVMDTGATDHVYSILAPDISTQSPDLPVTPLSPYLPPLGINDSVTPESKS